MLEFLVSSLCCNLNGKYIEYLNSSRHTFLMFTAILKSKTIASFGFSYLLGIGMLIFTLFNLSENGSIKNLLFSHWAFGWLEKTRGFLPYLGIILISATAVISRLRIRETKQALGNRNLSMIAFVALIMVQPNALVRPDILLAMFLSTTAFLLLLSIYKQESALSEIFHVGLLIGGASLFAGYSIFLIAVVLFSVLILRTGNWKEWAVLFLGLGMVSVFVMMFTIWHENPFLSFQRVIQSAWFGSIETAPINLGHIVLIPVIFLSFGGMLNSLTAGNVAERNFTLANIGWLVGVLFMVLTLGLGWQNGIILAAFPLSGFIAKTLENIKRWWIADLLLLLILSAPFVKSLWHF